MPGSKSPPVGSHAAQANEAGKHTRKVLNRERLRRNVIVMGASAGGVEVLIRIFSEMPPGLNAVIGVVLHRRAIKSQLLQVLGRRSALPILEPEHDARLKAGMIFLAPPDHHLELEIDRVVVRRGPKEHSTRPAIDPLFRSAAASFGARVVAVLLTGGGDDGVSGMVMIKENKGMCLVQDPADSNMPYMPLNAIRHDHVDGVLPAKSIATTLKRLVQGEVIEC